MKLQCPACLSSFDVGGGVVSSTVRCPDCGESVRRSDAVPSRPENDLDLDLDFIDDDDVQAVGSPSFESPPRQTARKPCPMCGESIAKAAIRCRFCGEDIGPGGASRSANPRAAETLKKFRQQANALGGFWIFIGLVVGMLGGGLMWLGNQPNGKFQFDQEMVGIFSVVFLFLSLVYIVIGALAIAKNVPAIYAGLVLTYIAIAGNCLSVVLSVGGGPRGAGGACGPIIGIVINLLVIIQAHRVIGWSRVLDTR